VLRHFLWEAEHAELYGCDIDAPSIDWLGKHLTPPLHAFVNDELPPLPFDDGELDLVWAFSVFTHIVDGWSDWLVELRRVLSPGGLLIASFLGRGVCEQLTGEPWVEGEFGMNVFGYGRPWDEGGPNVFLSPWWIRDHWGRAFEIVELRDSEQGHGFVLLKKPTVGPSLSPRELEQMDAGEPRERPALERQVRQLQHEVIELRTPLDSHVESPYWRELGRRIDSMRSFAREVRRRRR
jgi:SAM-dependent methyltransferase